MFTSLSFVGGLRLANMKSRLFTFCVLTLLLFACVRSKFIGAGVIPHGDFAFDPSLVHFENGSVELHRSAVKLGSVLMEMEPDIILLSSPHGLEDSNSFMFYANNQANGFALLGQDLHNASFPCYRFDLNSTSDPAVVASLITALGGSARNVSSLLGWGDGEPLPLRWGEVIPLSFLQQTHSKRLIDSLSGGAIPDDSNRAVAGHAELFPSSAHTQRLQQQQQQQQLHREEAHQKKRHVSVEHPEQQQLPRVVVLSQPARRYTQAPAMVPELLSLGASFTFKMCPSEPVC